jgi:uncharacterized protein YjbI with pentapeptide repeats
MCWPRMRGIDREARERDALDRERLAMLTLGRWERCRPLYEASISNAHGHMLGECLLDSETGRRARFSLSAEMVAEVTSEERWSEPEKWAWGKICAGPIADFHEKEGELDSGRPDGWNDERKLSPEFLEEILRREPYRNVTQFEGVRIVGAWFPGPVVLARVRLARQLGLERCRFKGAANLAGLHVDGWLSLEGSAFVAEQGEDLASLNLEGAKVGGHFSLKAVMMKDVDFGNAEVVGSLSLDGATVAGKLNMENLEVKQHLFMSAGVFEKVDLRSKIHGSLILNGARVTGTLDMNSLEVKQHLLMRAGAKFQDVDLRSAIVGGQLDMNGAFVGNLHMNSLEVKKSLFMGAGATFEDVNLGSAKVDGQLSMRGAQINGKLNMNSLEVKQHLFMSSDTRFQTKFQDVDLTSAKVGGQLSMRDAHITGSVNMEGLEVKQSLFMSDAKFAKPVELIFSSIGSNLDLSGAELVDLDLPATQIAGELRLGSAQHLRTRWQESAVLNLRNVHAGALQDRRDEVTNQQNGQNVWKDGWPDNLELDGFTYDRLGGFGGTAATGGTGVGGGDVDMLARDIGWYISSGIEADGRRSLRRTRRWNRRSGCGRRSGRGARRPALDQREHVGHWPSTRMI